MHHNVVIIQAAAKWVVIKLLSEFFFKFPLLLRVYWDLGCVDFNMIVCKIALNVLSCKYELFGKPLLLMFSRRKSLQRAFLWLIPFCLLNKIITNESFCFGMLQLLFQGLSCVSSARVFYSQEVHITEIFI